MLLIYNLSHARVDLAQINQVPIKTNLRLLDLSYSCEIERGGVSYQDFKELFNALRFNSSEYNSDIDTLVRRELLEERLQFDIVGPQGLEARVLAHVFPFRDLLFDQRERV